MRTRLRVPAPLIALLIAGGLIAGCGDDSSDSSTPASAGSDADPQAVLDTALGGSGDPIESGVLELEFGLQSEGGQVGTADASVTGPFESNGEGMLPSLDFAATASADTGGQSVSFDGGLTLTQDGLFVNYAGSDYQVDDATFGLLQDSYAQSAELQSSQGEGGSLSQFGIDPESWLTDVTNEGVEDVNGTETVHISGTADVAKIVGDLGTVAQASGQAEQLDPAALQQLQDSVQDASIDVYANSDDNTLRKLDVSLDIADPTGGADTASLTISIGIADPNTDQEITAPSDAKPISELLGQFPEVASSLGGLAPGAVTPPSAPAGSPGSEAYYQCVSQATTPADVTKCAELLNG